MSTTLKTNVSGTFWCTAEGDFKAAHVRQMSQRERAREQICWLDNLLEGGVRLPALPAGQDRALTVLLTGPPGSGKSTLALELCYRWSRDGKLGDEGPRGISCLYVTSEADETWMLDKVRSMGWDEQKFSSGSANRSRPPVPLVTIWQTTDFQAFLQHSAELTGSTQRILKVLGKLYTPLEGIEPVMTEYKNRWSKKQVLQRLEIGDPRVLVIDSLNTAQPDSQPELFTRFMELASSGPRIMVVILESDPSASAFWEYMADLVIRLDRQHLADYMIRTLEVVKARYQPHVWGVHQLKIYEPSPEEDRIPPKGKEEHREWRRNRRRAHPYREEGGIFIFPSIHYYLSMYKRAAPDVAAEPSPTSVERLDRTLGGGLPRGRCTGFVGIRGGHKSHLGYLHLLHKIVRGGENEKALIISLRDDEGLARDTLAKILLQHFPDGDRADDTTTGGGRRGAVDRGKELAVAKRRLDALMRSDKLEILYYPPGYITPEEFFHRMYLSLQRLKSDDRGASITLLFNSLDQLSSRFPLCAREQIFIPGIIETLSAEGVTSLFIGVEESGQPPEQYGLLSMADALLSFEQRELPTWEYLGHLIDCPDIRDRLTDEELGVIESQLGRSRKTVSLRVVRFAGGREAGAGGILELVDSHHGAGGAQAGVDDPRLALYGAAGLQFAPFSPNFSHGSVVRRTRGQGPPPLVAVEIEEDHP